MDISAACRASADLLMQLVYLDGVIRRHTDLLQQLSTKCDYVWVYLRSAHADFLILVSLAFLIDCADACEQDIWCLADAGKSINC